MKVYRKVLQATRTLNPSAQPMPFASKLSRWPKGAQLGTERGMKESGALGQFLTFSEEKCDRGLRGGQNAKMQNFLKAFTKLS